MTLKVIALAIAGLLCISAVVCGRALPGGRVDIDLAQPGDCSKEGDPGLYVDFGEETHDMIAGETFCWKVAPANFAFVSATCPDGDTFCVHVVSKLGWTLVGDPPLETSYELDPGYFYWQDVCLTVPCYAEVGERDTLVMKMTYYDETLACRDDCTDCEDPNWYSGNPYYMADTVIVEVVASPPAIYILQDSLYMIGQGQSAAYIPFEICNGDPCADSTVYAYDISSTGHIGSGFPQSGESDPIEGGDCGKVYAIVNAKFADVCDMDTLTIIAWDQASGTVYDTCVQLVHVVEDCCLAPLTPQVVAIMAVLMVLAAAIMIRRRVAGGA